MLTKRIGTAAGVTAPPSSSDARVQVGTHIVLEGASAFWGYKAVHHHELGGLKHQLQIGTLWEIVQTGTPGKPDALQSMGSQSWTQLSD